MQAGLEEGEGGIQGDGSGPTDLGGPRSSKIVILGPAQSIQADNQTCNQPLRSSKLQHELQIFLLEFISSF